MAVDPTRLATLLAEAACLGAAPPPWAGLTGPIEALLADGFSLEGDILPMIRRRRRPDIGSWAYYAAAIRGAAEAGRPPPSPAAVDEATWRARLAAFAADGYWPVGYGPEPGLEGCRVPGHLLGRGENEAGE